MFYVIYSNSNKFNDIYSINYQRSLSQLAADL